MAASKATQGAERERDAFTLTTDLSREAVAATARELRPWLADVFALYMKTKNFHWHMRGRHFRDYHLLLDEQGTQIFAMTDVIAERARNLGTATLHSISDIAQYQRLQDNNAAVTPQDMLGDLGADNQQLTRFLRATHAVCGEYHDVATASLIENWIDETERRTWFLTRQVVTWTPPTPSEGDVMMFNAKCATPAGCQFYFMKGLYITPASANGLGPQIIQTPAGESIQLQARVYNYSLADMPVGTAVHVRFYGQQWDNTARNLIGSAFVIQEVTLAPIPGFNSTSTGGQTPNWTLAGTTFDTTKYPDTYLIFWVVVWMEQNGQLVPEVAGHGLTAIPGTTTAPTAVAIEDHSNNIGFYNLPFFVAPPTSQLGAAPPAAGSLTVGEVAIAPAHVLLFDKATVTATLATGDASLDAVHVLFYDGDPEQGGEAFDAELVSHIRAKDTYVTKVQFQPRTCGQHTVVVVAGQQTAYAATGTATVDVAIDPVTSVAELITATTSFALPKRTKQSLLAKLDAAKNAFTRGRTTAALHQLNAFIHEVQAQRGHKLTAQQADQLLGGAQLILGCV